MKIAGFDAKSGVVCAFAFTLYVDANSYSKADESKFLTVGKDITIEKTINA